MLPKKKKKKAVKSLNIPVDYIPDCNVNRSSDNLLRQYIKKVKKQETSKSE